jgi:hypothetical protein
MYQPSPTKRRLALRGLVTLGRNPSGEAAHAGRFRLPFGAVSAGWTAARIHLVQDPSGPTLHIADGRPSLNFVAAKGRNQRLWSRSVSTAA